MPADVNVSDSFLSYPHANHGELPVWDPTNDRIAFVDMEPSPSVHTVRLDSSGHQAYAFDGESFCTGIFPSGSDRVLGGPRCSKLRWGLTRMSSRWQAQSGHGYAIERQNPRFPAARLHRRHPPFDFGRRSSQLETNSAERGRYRCQGFVASLRSLELNRSGRVWFATCKEGETNVEPQLYLLDAATRQCTPIPLPVKLIMSNAMVSQSTPRRSTWAAQRPAKSGPLTATSTWSQLGSFSIAGSSTASRSQKFRMA
jgi:hypothetical protein